MKTLIIDGNNLIHRTFWTAKKVAGENTGQLDNFHIHFTLNAIFSYVNRYKPTQTIVVWDEKQVKTQNTRKVSFPEYKGNRSADPAPHRNNNTVKRLLNSVGIPSIYPYEREADDIVAYICKTYAGSKVVVSVDRDFLQLVDSDTILFDPIRKREFIIDTFKVDTGWCKEEWLKAKCCEGDKSDNVPGIHRFGKVKIRKWLDGDLQLTVEQQQIVDRNLTLFSLDAVMQCKDECSYYQDQLDVPVISKWDKFITECEERDLKNILKKRDEWYNLFIMGNKLTQLLG
tara:strand:+ start:6040 stop:6897 length:858 start_codon:yes stop_codon:yes gene_type:complete